MHSQATEDQLIKELLFAMQVLDDGKVHSAMCSASTPDLDDFSQSLWIASIHSPHSVRLFAQGKERLVSSLLSANERYRAYLDSLNEGFTIVIDGISNLSRGWARVAALLQLASSNRVSANAYITPPHSSGFSRHSDSHDVLVVQMQGNKFWSIDGLPHGQELKIGNILAIPYGCSHEALAGDQLSIHVTLGLHRDADVIAFRNALAKAVKVTPALRSVSSTVRLRDVLKCIEALSDEALSSGQLPPPLIPGEWDILDQIHSWTAQLDVQFVPSLNAECRETDGGVLLMFGETTETTTLLVECDEATATALKLAFESDLPLSPKSPPNEINIRSWFQMLLQLQRDGAIVLRNASFP